MNYLIEKSTLMVCDSNIIDNSIPFDCGDEDLNDFFKSDVLDYSSQLLGKSYCFIDDDEPKNIVCAFALSNDSIKTYTLPNSRKKRLTQIFPEKNF